jgi:hypothetical protein
MEAETFSRESEIRAAVDAAAHRIADPEPGTAAYLRMGSDPESPNVVKISLVKENGEVVDTFDVRSHDEADELFETVLDQFKVIANWPG